MTIQVGDPIEFDFSKPMTLEHLALAVRTLGLPVVEAMIESAKRPDDGRVQQFVVTDVSP